MRESGERIGEGELRTIDSLWRRSIKMQDARETQNYLEQLHNFFFFLKFLKKVSYFSTLFKFEATLLNIH